MAIDLLMFGYPFSGDLHVSPDSLHVALLTLPGGQALSTPETH
jgi:hypothetical protein